MAYHDEPIPNKNKVKKQPKKCKSEQDKEYPLEDGRTYDIDRLNIGESANESESESE